jgi:hypothetical protein
MICCSSLIAVLAADVAHVQFGVPWQYTPSIMAVSMAGDSRLQAVEEAVSFWNRTLEEIGSGFRLGPIMHTGQPVPEEAFQSLSGSTLAGGPRKIPQALRDLPGDLTIFLARSEFVSFAGPFDANSKRVVGIRGPSFPPMNLPNVPRNVIAHELGHAIGLGHNSDPATLMCGRPAPCRPGLFRSDQPLWPLLVVAITVRELPSANVPPPLDASTFPFKERYAVSDDNVVKRIQPGAFDDQLTEILSQGARCLLARASVL